MLAGERLPVDFAESFDAVRDRCGPLAARILFFTTIGSTNDVALAAAVDADAEGTVVIADEQTAGRGRQGRLWHSPPGKGLYVSIVLRPARARSEPDRATGLLTLAAGVALADAIRSVTGLRADIKWPNDLVVGRRKLAGILAEAGGGEPPLVVLGYGINIGAAAFPADLEVRVTSLESELGRPVSRAALCAETVAAMAARYQDLMDGRFDAILDAWRDQSSTSRGARVSWRMPSGMQSGVTDGIDGRGALLVRTGDRLERIVGGEVIWT